MGLFSSNKKQIINAPQEMSPLESVTHLFAAIQIADQQASYEEKESWIGAISKLFPEHSSDRAETFFNQAHSVLASQSSNEKQDYLRSVLERIRSLLSKEQIDYIKKLYKTTIDNQEITVWPVQEFLDELWSSNIWK